MATTIHTDGTVSTDQPSHSKPDQPTTAPLGEIDLYDGSLEKQLWQSYQLTSSQADDVAKLIRHLITAERQRLQSALPEKKDVDWNDIGSPELVAKQSESYGWNQAIDAVTALLKGQTEEDV